MIVLEVGSITTVVLDKIVELVSLNTTVLELFKLDPTEKAYCGKTSTAITERKRKILRFISHNPPHSTNKELIYVVQEQCYPCHESIPQLAQYT